jgi:hypothetical protein
VKHEIPSPIFGPAHYLHYNRKASKEVRFDMHIICEVRTSEEKLKMPILDFR